MHLYNEQFNTPKYIINAFANYYLSSVYVNYENFNVIYNQNPLKVISSSIHSVSVEFINVFESLSSLTSNFNPGPDLIPSVFLRNCKYAISSPLFLFNLSLSTGIFSDAWKTSLIRPLFKNSSDLSNISNYRPISLVSLIPKQFLSMVLNKVIPALNNVIFDDQHGFRRNKSTITNILNFQTFVSDASQKDQMLMLFIPILLKHLIKLIIKYYLQK